MEVIIDGVRYVPVSEAHIDAPKIEHALVAQWGGENWRELYPEAAGYLRVIVTDSPEVADEGESIAEFVARIIARIVEARS